MTPLLTITVTATLLAAAGGGLWLARRLARMTPKEKKALLKTKLNGVFIWAEDIGLLQRTPAFNRDYLRDYPKLRLLEYEYEAVRDECLALLGIKEKLTDISVLGGAYTQAGIHTIRWKSFMFKSGRFIESNCELCPKTASVLKQIPGVYTAFFSILEPRQYITPHWGYYRGFLRYHLGVIIPDDNRDRTCRLRVNDDPVANRERDAAAIEEGEVYYWRNGEGVIFDDNYLHDAANDSDGIRVILWLDLRRKMPFYLQWFNMLCLAIAHREPSVRRIRENARIAT